jgi:hypothetical protein
MMILTGGSLMESPKDWGSGGPSLIIRCSWPARLVSAGVFGR